MRRPQHTEDAQRLEARTARTFEAPLRAIGLKLSVDYCSNFNRFSLLSQALVQDLRACPAFP